MPLAAPCAQPVLRSTVNHITTRARAAASSVDAAVQAAIRMMAVSVLYSTLKQLLPKYAYCVMEVMCQHINTQAQAAAGSKNKVFCMQLEPRWSPKGMCAWNIQM